MVLWVLIFSPEVRKNLCSFSLKTSTLWVSVWMILCKFILCMLCDEINQNSKVFDQVSRSGYFHQKQITKDNSSHILKKRELCHDLSQIQVILSFITMIHFVNLHLTILNNCVQNSIWFSDFIYCIDISPTFKEAGRSGSWLTLHLGDSHCQFKSTV